MDKHYVLYDYRSHQQQFRHPRKWDELHQFLQQTWENRLRLHFEIPEEDIQHTEQKILTLGRGDVMHTHKYVGVIRHDGLKIDIKPRIFEDVDKYDHWKNLLYWLSYCSKIKFPFNRIPLDVEKSDDLFDILIVIFARYTSEVVANQPYSCYEEEICESRTIKGSLQIEDYIRKSIVTGNWHKFQIKHKPFTFDNLANRIIKHVSRMLCSISDRASVELSRILDYLDEVSDVECTAADCHKMSINPVFEEYKSIIGMCEMFLDNLMIDTADDNKHNFAFLLPMDYVFEDFIFGFINTHLPELSPRSQSETWLATRDDRKIFKIKNDIILDNPKLIIDTKYKLRYSDSDGKSGVSQSDMYQMVAYSVRRGINDVLLLYPYNEDGFNKATRYEVIIELPGCNQKIRVNTASVDIRIKHFNDSSETERIKQELTSILADITKEAV